MHSYIHKHARTCTPPPTHIHSMCNIYILIHLQDAFGNYVVQYVLELGQVEASQVLRGLKISCTYTVVCL